jgi:hypothetical protein
MKKPRKKKLMMIVSSLTKKQIREHEAKVRKLMNQPDVFG